MGQIRKKISQYWVQSSLTCTEPLGLSSADLSEDLGEDLSTPPPTPPPILTEPEHVN